MEPTEPTEPMELQGEEACAGDFAKAKGSVSAEIWAALILAK